MDVMGSVQQVLHSIKMNKLSTVMKIDIGKAYDKVNWTFLILVLLQIGFTLEWVNWIMGCMTLVSFVVLVNGSPSYFLKSIRGLRQGCPIITLFFLLVAESLSR